MLVQIKKLANRTEFKYGCVTYRIVGDWWVAQEVIKANQKMLSLDTTGKVIKVIPKLGGMFQEELPEWIGHETEVEVYG